MSFYKTFHCYNLGHPFQNQYNQSINIFWHWFGVSRGTYNAILRDKYIERNKHSRRLKITPSICKQYTIQMISGEVLITCSSHESVTYGGNNMRNLVHSPLPICRAGSGHFLFQKGRWGETETHTERERVCLRESIGQTQHVGTWESHPLLFS